MRHPPALLPIEPLQSLNQIEMPVAAQYGEGVLAAQGANPSVITRDRGTGLFELAAKIGIP
jgi:hypothetical protein